MVDDIPFSPDWVSPPGATIVTILEERGATPVELADWIERSPADIADLLEGRAEITVDMASRLARVLGASEAFWTRRESQYRADLARLHKQASLPESVSWLSEIPVKDIERWGWIPPLSNPTTAVTACLRFFGVPSVKAWRHAYGDTLSAAYRTSPTYKSEPGAVAAWLRQGEVMAASIECGPWDQERFRRELASLRELTREKDPQKFLPELIERCAACGVAVVVQRAPKQCRASGVVRFLSSTRPMILLSFRYLSDDHFWFTFFHEVGHVVLHSDRCIFLEGKDTLTTVQEAEADAFAANILIPPEYQVEMLRLPLNGREVMRFARKAGVSPGIVVGQLQHYKRLQPSQLNNLKRRYTWIED